MKSIILYFLAIILLSSCSASSKTWKGYSSDEIWTAMIAVAKSPDYSADNPRNRWHVLENVVQINTEDSEIKIHRILRRSIKLAMQSVQVDNREMILKISLENNEFPEVKFEELSSQIIPARALNESHLFFNQLDELLGS